MICKWSVFVVAWSFSSHSHACAGCCLRRQSNQSITHSPCLACKAVASANHIPAALAYSVRGEAREAARDRLPPPVLPSIGNHTTHTHTAHTEKTRTHRCTSSCQCRNASFVDSHPRAPPRRS